jgi:hypothetical protein
LEVFQSSSYGCDYSCSWIILFKGFNQAVPSLTVNAGGLSGGTNSPRIEKTIRRPFSTSLEFDPIDYRFLHT